MTTDSNLYRRQIDPALKQWATEKQASYIDAVNEHSSCRAAAKVLGVHHSVVSGAIAAVQKKAREDLVKPLGRPPGFTVREVSTQYGADGETIGTSLVERPESPFEPGGIGAGPERDGLDEYSIAGVSTYFNQGGEQVGQWIKTRADRQMQVDSLRAALEAAAEELPRVPLIAAPPAAESKLLNLFTLTDCHVGMLAWHEEGGSDWDLKIAEATLVKAFAHMIHSAPRARVAVVNQLGDFLHFDGMDAVTPTNRHLLDADGRFRKITKVAIRIMRRVIDMALETHDEVRVVCAEGNHDLASSGWLAVLLEAVYEDNPRVVIDDSAIPFYRVMFGQVMLGFHHGHTKKMESLPLLFAQQYRADWGASKHTFIHTGHRHHLHELDQQGVKLVQHPTLAARDAYAARHGYLAVRQAMVITYHEEWGEWGRSYVTPEMIGES